MSESNPDQATSFDPQPPRARSRRWLFLALPAVLVGGALAANAYAFGPRGDLSPEQMQKFVERRLDRILDGIDATDDQKVRIKGSVARLHPEMRALHEEKARLHEAGHKALQADPIDAAEVERIRREVVKLADRGSTLFSRALVEVGNVLTAEQRKELLSHLERHRHRRWH